MGEARLRGRAAEGRPGDMPTRLDASEPGATVHTGAVVREIGRSVALLALTGLSVGGTLSMVVVAFHALER